MKNLLTLAAIAIMFTSCTVDSVQDEKLQDLSDSTVRAMEDAGFCENFKVINKKGEARGIVEVYVDQDMGILMLSIKSNGWKIRSSDLYLGTFNNINSLKPDLFEQKKYNYNESFKNGTYIANYVFSLSDVDDDFCFMALLNVSNDNITEDAWTYGVSFNGLDGGMYVQNFLNTCLK